MVFFFCVCDSLLLEFQTQQHLMYQSQVSRVHIWRCYYNYFSTTGIEQGYSGGKVGHMDAIYMQLLTQ